MDNALIDQPAAVTPDRAPSPPGADPGRGTRAWRVDVRSLVMIAILLGASGAYRYWRDFQFATLESESRACPFPLKEISTSLGGWRMLEGAEATLDPQIARVAGSSDHIVRTYENSASGEKATVLVLYGPSQLVWSHTPELCYPSTGFRPMVRPKEVTVPGRDGAPGTTFRLGFYGRTDAGASVVNEVFHSFRNAGSWTPNMSGRWKQFRYNPGMFKIQVERRVQDADDRDESCYDLLAALVAEIEDRVRPAAAPVVAAQ